VNDLSSAAQQPDTPKSRSAPVPMALPFSRPLWSWVFLGGNIVVWLAMMVITALQNGGVLAGDLRVSSQVLVMFGAKVNQLIAEGQFWRLLTANFLHVSLFHLLFNTYALWQLGPEVERTYGRTRFVILYLLTGMYGAVASYAWGGYLSVGASGAIFGLVGALIAYFLRHHDLFGRPGRAYLGNMVIIVVINLFIGVSTPGIDNWGHIGGLASGFLLGYGLAPIYALPPGYLGGPARLIDTNPPVRRATIILAALVVVVAATTAITVQQRDSAAAHMIRAQEALEAGDLATAEKELVQAARREPDRAEAYFYLGVIRARQGEVAEAAAQWERAGMLDPSEPNTAWNLALAYEALGRRDEAIAQLERYLTLVNDEASAAKARKLLSQWQPGLGERKD